MADASYAVSLAAVGAMIKSGDIRADSMLVLVPEEEKAGEVCVALGLDGFTVVNKKPEFLQLLESCKIDVSQLVERSINGDTQLPETFKKKYGKLIVTLNALHAILDKYSDGGEQDDEDTARSFCVSDMLADCGYQFVLVVGAYSFVQLTSSAQMNEIKKYSDDCFEFCATQYFSDIAHSYNRLKKLVASSEGCVFMSPYIAGDSAAELYAALGILADKYKYYATKKRLYAQIGEDYRGEAVYMMTNVIMYPSYSDLLASLSFEEVFVKMIDANERLFAVDPSNDRAERDFCHIERGDFGDVLGAIFADELKEHAERELHTQNIRAMEIVDIAILRSSFEKYGVLHKCAITRDNCGYAYFQRMVSPFEYYLHLKRNGWQIEGAYDFEINDVKPKQDADELHYIIFDKTDMLEHKCNAVCNAYAAKKDIAIEFPLLLAVSSEDMEKKVEIATRAFKNFDVNVLSGRSSIGLGGEKTVYVLSVDELAEMAKPVDCCKYAVICDGIADPIQKTLLIQKLILEGVRKAYIFDDDETLSHNMDIMNKRLIYERSGNLAPMCVAPRKADGAYKYAFDAAECVYDALFNVVDNSSGTEKTFADTYGDVVSKFCHIIVSGAIAKRDFKYMKKLSQSLNSVCLNSASMDFSGEQIYSDPPAPAVRGEKEKSPVIFFDVCPEYLFRRCDIVENHCSDCVNYQNRINLYDEFCKGYDAFISGTIKFIEKARDEDLRNMSIDSVTISAAGEAQLYGEGMMSRINMQRPSVPEQCRTTTCHVSFGQIDAVRRFCVSIYAQALDKYFETVQQITKDASSDADRLYCRLSEMAQKAE